MRKRDRVNVLVPVTRARRAATEEADAAFGVWRKQTARQSSDDATAHHIVTEPTRTSQSRSKPQLKPAAAKSAPTSDAARSTAAPASLDSGAKKVKQTRSEKIFENERKWLARRGHLISYVGLFLYTAVVYFRPYELFESLAFLSSISYWLALFTLLVFLPSQIALEGTLTARPREVNLVFLFTIAALLSMPFAMDRNTAWETFNFLFVKVVIMFIVMVNVMRTELRMKGLLLLALAVGCVISASAFNDYRLGQFNVEGYRVVGNIGGMFGNANDMALHLATMIPIAVALMLNSRGPLKKVLYAGCSLLMLAGTFVTYSRGAFLGLIGASAIMVWKLAKRNRLLVFGLVIGVIVVAMALMPGGYGNRLLSIFDYSRDPVGSAPARQALLIRSFWVALRHPLLGIGMGNFPIVSIAGQVSHNSYTQVASELGMPALVVYVLMIITSLRRLGRVERDSFEVKEDARFYYLSVGLQASLVCYMISSFFLSVAYVWNIYYLIGYALCLHRTFETRPAAKKAIKVTNQQEEFANQEERPAVKVEQSGSAGATNGRRVLAPLAREGFDVAK